MPDGSYDVIMNEGQPNGGIMKAPDPNMPTAWTVYFTVDDAHATVTKAKELGASVMMGPDTFEGVGDVAWLQDGQGAVFAVIKPAPQPDQS